jgi:WhiB family redox-sensing transcriptional regulator
MTILTATAATQSTEPIQDWSGDARCKTEDPEMFFPVGQGPEALRQAEQAKAVCRQCPVMQQCLSWAMKTGQDAGVWGGLAEDERRLLKRRLARKVSTPQLQAAARALAAEHGEQLVFLLRERYLDREEIAARFGVEVDIAVSALGWLGISTLSLPAVTAETPLFQQMLKRGIDLQERRADGLSFVQIARELNVGARVVQKVYNELADSRKGQFDPDRIARALRGERVLDLNHRERTAVIVDARDRLGYEWTRVGRVAGASVSQARSAYHRRERHGIVAGMCLRMAVAA